MSDLYTELLELWRVGEFHLRQMGENTGDGLGRLGNGTEGVTAAYAGLYQETGILLDGLLAEFAGVLGDSAARLAVGEEAVKNVVRDYHATDTVNAGALEQAIPELGGR